jgi:hypothetical protein
MFGGKMANEYSVDDLLEFLDHASDRGLMPPATAQSLAVAARSVFAILSDEERIDLRQLDLDAVTKRFNNKRAKDFNPSSLKEYDRRAHRAVALFRQWREDPANFSPKTRTTSAKAKKRGGRAETDSVLVAEPELTYSPAVQAGRGYQSAFPIRPGMVVTLSNIPNDLTPDEAERLATFVRMLAVG